MLLFSRHFETQQNVLIENKKLCYPALRKLSSQLKRFTKVDHKIPLRKRKYQMLEFKRISNKLNYQLGFVLNNIRSKLTLGLNRPTQIALARLPQ